MRRRRAVELSLKIVEYLSPIDDLELAHLAFVRATVRPRIHAARLSGLLAPLLPRGCCRIAQLPVKLDPFAITRVKL